MHSVFTIFFRLDRKFFLQKCIPPKERFEYLIFPLQFNPAILIAIDSLSKNVIKYRDTQYVKHPIYFLFRSSFHVAPHNGSRIFLASRFRLVIFILPSTHGLKNITNYYFPSINIYIYISFLETYHQNVFLQISSALQIYITINCISRKYLLPDYQYEKLISYLTKDSPSSFLSRKKKKIPDTSQTKQRPTNSFPIKFYQEQEANLCYISRSGRGQYLL